MLQVRSVLCGPMNGRNTSQVMEVVCHFPARGFVSCQWCYLHDYEDFLSVAILCQLHLDRSGIPELPSLQNALGSPRQSKRRYCEFPLCVIHVELIRKKFPAEIPTLAVARSSRCDLVMWKSARLCN